MKTIKITCSLLLLAVAFASCEKISEWFNHEPYYHDLLLSFQDASGNDLVKGIGCNWTQYTNSMDSIWTIKHKEIGGWVKPELYELDIVFPEGIPNPWEATPYYIPTTSPEVYLHTAKVFEDSYPELSAYDYLHFFTSSERKYGGDPRKITFRLKCPYVFGDDNVHEIVTWWKADFFYNKTKLCSIQFDGKEMTDITTGVRGDESVAIVIL